MKASRKLWQSNGVANNSFNLTASRRLSKCYVDASPCTAQAHYVDEPREEKMQEWIICLEECLPDFGINLDRENIEKLAKVIQENASCISDMRYEMRGGRATKQGPDYKALYERSQNELFAARHENDVFRSSVASRCKVDISSVRIENDTVMVYP